MDLSLKRFDEARQMQNLRQRMNPREIQKEHMGMFKMECIRQAHRLKNHPHNSNRLNIIFA
jgi:hypothetical protein